MPINIGINGTGVLGRRLLRMIADEQLSIDGTNVVLAAINDGYTSPEQLQYLYNHDTVYGKPKNPIESVTQNSDGSYDLYMGMLGRIQYTTAKYDSAGNGWGNTRWSDAKTGVVIDCMGRYMTETAQKSHLESGGYAVITCLDSSSTTDIAEYVYSINESAMSSQKVTVYGCSSGDVIASSLIANVLDNGFGLDLALCEHITSYTNLNNLQDSALSRTELQIGRAGAWNIIPCNSSAANKIGRIIPQLNGKITGFEHRCGTIAGSHTDVFANLKKDFNDTDYAAVIKAFTSVVMGYSEDVLETSSDVIGMTQAVINVSDYTSFGTFVRVGVSYDAISLQAENAIQLAAKAYKI